MTKGEKAFLVASLEFALETEEKNAKESQKKIKRR